ncbi:MAG: glucosaminidase domain-containing protein [Chitinophagaceae bacterium]
MRLKSFLEKGRKGLLILFLFLFLKEVSGQSKYIREFKPIADSLSAIYGIPTSVMLGIAIIESGAGKSRNCRLLNNHFGIKGKNNLVKTKGIKSAYKQYPDGRSSYVAFSQLMTRKKFYKRLKGKMDYRLWLDAISKSGYSTVPLEWKKNITSTIKKHKLAESR